MDIVAGASGGVTRSQLAQTLNLSRATAHRLVAALEQFGLVRLDERGRVYVGVSAARWGLAALEQNEVRTMALPVMEELARETGETVWLGVRRAKSVAFIERVYSNQAIRVTGRIGALMPLYASGAGMCLLAGFESDKEILSHIGPRLVERAINGVTSPRQVLAAVREVQGNGYVVDQGGNLEEVYVVAAPIYDHTDRVVAALSVTGPEMRMKAKLDEVIRLVVTAARDVSHSLGY